MISSFQHGPVRELRLNRPPVNALSPELMTALTEGVQAAVRDGTRAIVLSGSPGRFSAGLDLPLLLTLDRAGMADLLHLLYGLFSALACSPIPVAAAITGHAPAGGTVVPLFCDWRVMAEGDWKLGLNEVAVGLVLPPVIHHALRLIVGARQAERLTVSGILISPAEAARIGLVDELVPPDHVISRAIAWCQSLLAVPAQAMADTRAQARAELMGLFQKSFDREIDDLMTMWWRPETQGALKATLEALAKRKESSAAKS